MGLTFWFVTTSVILSFWNCIFLFFSACYWQKFLQWEFSDLVVLGSFVSGLVPLIFLVCVVGTNEAENPKIHAISVVIWGHLYGYHIFTAAHAFIQGRKKFKSDFAAAVEREIEKRNKYVDDMLKKEGIS